MNTIFIGIKEFRQNIAKIVDRSSKTRERLVVLRHNKPVLDVRPIVPEDKTVSSFVSDIKEAMDDRDAGRVFTQKEIKKMFSID